VAVETPSMRAGDQRSNRSLRQGLNARILVRGTREPVGLRFQIDTYDDASTSKPIKAEFPSAQQERDAAPEGQVHFR